MRMLRMGQIPMMEAMAALPPRAPKPGLLLSLPETETTIPLDGGAFLAHLAVQTNGLFDVKYSMAEYRGRAGGLAAIGRAVELVTTGAAPVMLVGGVDSYRDVYVLETLHREGRVKSSSNLDGLIPGEGGGDPVDCERRVGGSVRAGATGSVIWCERIVRVGALLQQ